MIPPLWMSVSVRPGSRGGARAFRLWLPLFLLWLLAFFILPLLLVAFVLFAVLFGPRTFTAVAEVYRMLCALRGLRVDVDGPDERVRVRVY
jgi:hypothetical protein